MRAIPFILLLLSSNLALAQVFGGDVVEQVTQSGTSATSANEACSAAAKRLKENVSVMGWKILTKGNVPCACTATNGEWQCHITATVQKPEDEAARD
jgi:hypothetical protein